MSGTFKGLHYLHMGYMRAAWTRLSKTHVPFIDGKGTVDTKDPA